jgi:hypothetical protein
MCLEMMQQHQLQINDHQLAEYEQELEQLLELDNFIMQ